MIINILVSCGAELGLLGFVWLLGKITKTLVRNTLIRYIKPNLNQFLGPHEVENPKKL